jgi:hypothetical protein
MIRSNHSTPFEKPPILWQHNPKVFILLTLLSAIQQDPKTVLSTSKLISLRSILMLSSHLLSLTSSCFSTDIFLLKFCKHFLSLPHAESPWFTKYNDFINLTKCRCQLGTIYGEAVSVNLKI